MVLVLNTTDTTNTTSRGNLQMFSPVTVLMRHTQLICPSLETGTGPLPESDNVDPADLYSSVGQLASSLVPDSDV